ncbi:sodium:neurotransmitter symporter family protein [Gregarina niphandrodes]|uniref:Sodium:neurotransmitter symporter family protein n=1 Tax=Gregarina niphandrodes TaxID=110365 RepID=A0A023BC51_GRENI|nr:sodium:neurotransmitter symporter family protein [Gregarina niphandrodes]EZG81601.1 sodium:neurotransmitter symporter family protein [Gregarina niphandrodes]|eukprot:XP_011134216.1 sodium:neurotransmitter symporter family protein [Gregarina niphandrodes]
MVRQMVPWSIAREATYQASVEGVAFAALVKQREQQVSSEGEESEESEISEASVDGFRRGKKKLVFRQSKHAYLAAVIGLLTLRRYSEMFKMAEIWGGYTFLLPYLLSLLFLGWPIMTLEMCLGNLLRGGIGKSFEAVTPALRLAAPLAILNTLIYYTNMLYELTHHVGAACGYWSNSPGWIPPESVRVDCEQTKPLATSCSRKEGCILFDNVCTYDPIYWAQLDSGNRKVISNATMWAIVATYVLILFAAQGFQFKLRSICNAHHQ